MDWNATWYLPSACNMQDLVVHASCLSGIQDVKKPAKRLAGYLESLIISFFTLINSMFHPPG